MTISSLMPLITALLWAIRQRVVLIPCRPFGTTYRSHLQGSRINEDKSCCVMAQKSSILIYFAVETGNHAWCRLLPASIDLLNESSILGCVGKEMHKINTSPFSICMANCNFFRNLEGGKDKKWHVLLKLRLLRTERQVGVDWVGPSFSNCLRRK